MPIKRSAILLMVLAAGSISLLVFSSAKSLSADPASCALSKCSKQVNDTRMLSPWDMISQFMFRPVV